MREKLAAVIPAGAFHMSIIFILPRTVREGVEARRMLILDLSERILIVAMFAHFAWQMLSAYEERPNIGMLLVVVSEVITIVMIVVRRFTASLSQEPLDWLLAIAGCCTPLIAIPAAERSPEIAQIGAGIMLLGLCVQISAKVILFRSFGIVAANRGVQNKGPYRFVRHPMYAGYVVAHFGYLVGWPSTHNICLYTLALIIQIARILREEDLLLKDPVYREYYARVRYRLLPGVF
jgi:protein-S-isoprenylcysteine O-methyltransferase Ste14